MSFLSLSYSPNYFSIEDIVLQDTRVSCKFEVNVPKLGILDQSSDNEDLKQGSKVDVPFWMIPTLHAKKVITFEVPRYYKVNYRQILKADSFVVDLHKWGPHFYDLGLHVARLELRDSLDMKRCLIEVNINVKRVILFNIPNSLPNCRPSRTVYDKSWICHNTQPIKKQYSLLLIWTNLNENCLQLDSWVLKASRNGSEENRAKLIQLPW